MATETFEFEGAAGVDHYVAVFKTSNGHVFDWNDGTFKAFGSATEKAELASEVANIGGSLKSLFKLAIDLATINNTGTPLEVAVNWFTNAGATDCVSNVLIFKVTSGAISGGSTGSISELTGDPGATPTLEEILMLLYMDLRNGCQVDKNPALRKIRNDAGDVILQATLDDDGTRFLRGKLEVPSP